MKRPLSQWILQERLKPLVNFKGTPHALALAFGMGVALGILPGTGAIASAAVATVLRLNLLIAVVGALLINPITTPFVYLGSYLLGQWLLGSWLPVGMAARAVTATVVGNLILAIGLGVGGYLVALGLILLIRQGRGASQVS